MEAEGLCNRCNDTVMHLLRLALAFPVDQQYQLETLCNSHLSNYEAFHVFFDCELVQVLLFKPGVVCLVIMNIFDKLSWVGLLSLSFMWCFLLGLYVTKVSLSNFVLIC